MKKIACMLAVGVLAVGASAQAAEVYSSEYAVITIPVATGAANNLVGVSVLPGDDATFADVFPDVNGDAQVQKYTGSSYTALTTPSQLTVENGDAVWLNTASVSTIHALGETVSGSDSVAVTVPGGFGPIASPFAASWSIDDTDLAVGSSPKRSAANRIHVWNAETQKYDSFWYAAADSEWVPVSGSATLPTSFGAGQGVFVQLGSNRSGTTVTFTAPAE